jgi:predicted Zn-dependent protease
MIIRYFFTACALLVLTSCTTVPITGRSQLNLLPGSSMLSMSLQQYDSFMKEHKLSTDKKQTDTVKHVGSRIQVADGRYFTSTGMNSRLSGYAWEFKLVVDKEVNDWCTPGGKVVVYSDILPVTQGEGGTGGGDGA